RSVSFRMFYLSLDFVVNTHNTEWCDVLYCVAL
ncbi:MAG: hypothetical protein ACI9Y1_002903, partial [Lentisphaeria bacterium]